MENLQELKSVLDYLPEDGIFLWKIAMRRGTIPAGSKAGADTGGGWISIKYKSIGYNANRLAWYFTYNDWPENVPVPINGVRSDYRIENLLSREDYEELRSERFGKTVSHSDLLEILNYNPETGDFHWKRTMNSRALKDSLAGTDNRGYEYIRIYGRGYRAARLAWFYVHGEWPENQIDHKDRDGSNDRFENLRDVTSKENCANRGGYFASVRK